MSIESHTTHPIYQPGADGDGTWSEEAHPTRLGPLDTRWLQIMHELAAENRLLKDEKHRLEEENQRLQDENQRIIRGIPEMTRACYQQGDEDRAAAQHSVTDVDGVPPEVVYASAYGQVSSHPLDVRTRIDDRKVLIAGLKPGADPAAVVTRIRELMRIGA